MAGPLKVCYLCKTLLFFLISQLGFLQAQNPPANAQDGTRFINEAGVPLIKQNGSWVIDAAFLSISSSITEETDGSVTFSFSFPTTDSSFITESSTDLINWSIVVPSSTIISGSTTIVTFPALGRAGYYRVSFLAKEERTVGPAKFSIVGDSMSVGATGLWSTLAQSHPFFKNTDFNIVARSGDKTFDQGGDYWNENVLPFAPGENEVAYMSTLLGTNDIFQIGVSAGTVAETFERLKDIWIKGREAGFKVIAFTLPQHSYGAAGIVEAEQRKSQFNRMILAAGEFYDYLVPLHELIPDENTYAFNPSSDPPDLLHLNAEGNQVILSGILNAILPDAISSNTEPKDRTLAIVEENALRLALANKDSFYAPYNLALGARSGANGGSVVDHFGFVRLKSAAQQGSQAALQFEWPLLDSGNSISFARSRYRGLYIDLDPVNLSTDQIYSCYLGTDSVAKDGHYFGFDLRRTGLNYEIRLIELESGQSATQSDWENIGNTSNLKVLLFAKDREISLFFKSSNGVTPGTVWQEINHGGGPLGFLPNHARVVAAINSTGTPSSTGTVTLRELVPLEGEKLPFRRVKY